MHRLRMDPGICTYCGKEGPVTSDHVPPKSLFAKQRPSDPDLITVPACEDCREGTGKDDEYLRYMLAFRADPEKSRDPAAAVQRALRGLRRPEQQDFRQAIWDCVQIRRLRTPTGLFVGHAPTYAVGLERIEGVVKRTVRGLCRHHMNERLPTDAQVTVWAEDAFRTPDPEVMQPLLTILGPVLNEPEQVKSDRAFVYRYVLTDGGGFGSAWLVRFYQDVRFLGITIPCDYDDPTTDEA